MIREFDGKKPQIADSAFAAENATILGEVILEEGASVWYGAVLRGDINHIRIGKRSNIQDLTAVHVDNELPVEIGDDVTVGHSAVLHGCTVENRCLIGMGAIVLDGALVREGTIVAAGALVPPGKKVGPRALVAGIPARKVRSLSDKECEELKNHAESYVKYAERHEKI